MIKGIIQNHVTHPYIIANISTNILSGCFLCCKQRIKEYFCMLINLTEEWAGNSISPVSLSTRWTSQGSECVFHLLPSLPAWSLCFIFAPRLFALPFDASLSLERPHVPTLLCPLSNSLHKRCQDSYLFLPVGLSPQPVPFSSVYLQGGSSSSLGV